MFLKQRFKEAVSRVPFKVLVPFVYTIYFLSVLLWILALPLIFVYRLVLSMVAWFLVKPGRDVLLVTNASGDYGPWLSQVIPLIEKRAVFLNYEERRSWPRWSLNVLLFNAFGPRPMPDSFMPHCLPSVTLFRRFRAPQQFSFGRISKDHQTKLDQLRSALASRRAARKQS